MCNKMHQLIVCTKRRAKAIDFPEGKIGWTYYVLRLLLFGLIFSLCYLCKVHFNKQKIRAFTHKYVNMFFNAYV